MSSDSRSARSASLGKLDRPGLVAALKACGALQFGTFTLASGKTSSYYVDIKRAITRPDLLRRSRTGSASGTEKRAARFCLPRSARAFTRSFARANWSVGEGRFLPLVPIASEAVRWRGDPGNTFGYLPAAR